jgi:antagonist of KipI
MKIRILSAGYLTSVQDLGHTGFRQAGVCVGGALDSHALRVANAVVGNEDDAAGLETTLGKVRIQFEDRRVVAWCGGRFTVRINGEDLLPGHAALVGNSDELLMNAPTTGARAWLAVSGGIDVPKILGSRSTDLRGNFGGYEGRSLRDGDLLSLGHAESLKERRFETATEQRQRSQLVAPWISKWSAPTNWASLAKENAVLRIIRGSDWNRFTNAAQASLVSTSFTVTQDSDRMGVRLEGLKLDRVDAGDLLSEAVAPGTLQVPPSGQPILLLADCQTIGGYPKIAHVISVDLPVAAQLWSGDAVHFHEVSLAEAKRLLREREEDFARFRVGLRLHA